MIIANSVNFMGNLCYISSKRQFRRLWTSDSMILLNWPILPRIPSGATLQVSKVFESHVAHCCRLELLQPGRVVPGGPLSIVEEIFHPWMHYRAERWASSRSNGKVCLYQGSAVALVWPISPHNSISEPGGLFQEVDLELDRRRGLSWKLDLSCFLKLQLFTFQ